MEQRTLYINARFLTQPITGVQRYARELVNQFDQLLEEPGFKNLEITCLVPPQSGIVPPWKNIPVKEVGLLKGNAWEQIDLPLYVRGGLLFSPANSGPLFHRNQIITLHDANVYAVPEAYSLLFRLKIKITFNCMVLFAKLILTDSYYSQQQLSQYLKKPKERFNVIHLAGDHIQDLPADESILKKHRLQKNNFLLMVASQSPHKNFARAKRGVELSNAKMQVAIAGGQFTHIFNQNQPEVNSKDIKILGHINNAQLRALFENAFAYLFASYHEGFGIPVLEAMQCGCPVLCSNATSLPEAAGDAALYFDPFDEQQIADAIDKAASSPQIREALIQKGYEHARNFSWRKTAMQTLERIIS